MSSNVVPFRDPYLPLEGAERLQSRRIYSAACRTIAPEYVAKAFAATFKTPGTWKLGCDDALPVFVAAMRRELRKSGLF
jgi:hypothetical protein